MVRFKIQAWHKLWLSLSFIALFAVIIIPPFQVKEEVSDYWEGKYDQEDSFFQRTMQSIRSLRNYSLRDVEREKEAHETRKHDLSRQRLHNSERQQLLLLKHRYTIWISYWVAFTIFMFLFCWGGTRLGEKHKAKGSPTGTS
ncbi:MAG: hypothetical protein EOM20_13825 [Spartobacteria bacterium]|nr:hypothetical protein [Spartobacteria bacterium]